VRAWDFDGTPRWTAELDDAVVALEHGGTQGIAIVSISDDEGGRVVMLDGWTGLVIEEVATPSVVPGFAVSRDGSTLALVLDDETHFYDLLPGR
jgi:dipeptidyl aminopeptidase/acylaminoacyl peptidase